LIGQKGREAQHAPRDAEGDEKRGKKKDEKGFSLAAALGAYIAVTVYDVVLRFLVTIDAMVVHLLRFVAFLHVNHESIP
jgi:hypothetical protein